jgi:hypothetical protein
MNELASALASAETGSITSAQVSATAGQTRAAPRHRPAITIRTPMAAMPSMDSGQKRSSARKNGSSERSGANIHCSDEAIASPSRTCSACRNPRASRPVPVARVRNWTATSATSPSWNSRELAL